MVSDFHANFISIRYSKPIATDILDLIINNIFPPLCVGCNSPGSWICQSCTSSGLIRLPEECMVCRERSDRFTTHPSCVSHSSLKQVIIFWEYSILARKVMHTIKSDLRYRIMKSLALQSAHIAKDLLPPGCVLVPVPTSPARQSKRGFNQTAVLVKEIGYELGIPVFNLLSKKETDEHQTGKKRMERLKIDRQAFFASKDHTSIPPHLPLVLVDDVCTTGSTLIACAATLADEGYDKISAMALFRGKRKDSFQKLRLTNQAPHPHPEHPPHPSPQDEPPPGPE
jgi:ComF family protein